MDYNLSSALAYLWLSFCCFCVWIDNLSGIRVWGCLSRLVGEGKEAVWAFRRGWPDAPGAMDALYIAYSEVTRPRVTLADSTYT